MVAAVAEPVVHPRRESLSLYIAMSKPLLNTGFGWATLASNQMHRKLLTCGFILVTCAFVLFDMTLVDTRSHLWHAQWHADGTHRRDRKKARDAPP